MIKKDRIQSYPYAFKASEEFVDSVLFSRHFSQRLVGDVNG